MPVLLCQTSRLVPPILLSNCTNWPEITAIRISTGLRPDSNPTSLHFSPFGGLGTVVPPVPRPHSVRHNEHVSVRRCLVPRHLLNYDMFVVPQYSHVPQVFVPQTFRTCVGETPFPLGNKLPSLLCQHRCPVRRGLSFRCSFGADYRTGPLGGMAPPSPPANERAYGPRASFGGRGLKPLLCLFAL